MAEPIVLRLSLRAHEAEILLLCVSQASHTTWTDPATRKGMREFAEWVKYAVQAQCPHIKIDQEFGDFS